MPVSPLYTDNNGLGVIKKPPSGIPILFQGNNLSGKIVNIWQMFLPCGVNCGIRSVECFEHCSC